MIPVTPVLSEEFASNEIVYAKNQPEYTPLPTLRNSAGVITSRWKLTEEERLQVANGADIFLSVWTFNDPLQPVLLEVRNSADALITIAKRLEII